MSRQKVCWSAVGAVEHAHAKAAFDLVQAIEEHRLALPVQVAHCWMKAARR